MAGGVREAVADCAGLIQRAKAYDRAAFADLYRFAVAPVHRYLSARLNTREETEELTQDVFLAALNGIQSLRAEDEAGLLAWLFQISRNKLADHLRRQYRHPTNTLAEAEELEEPDPTPEEVAVLKDERAGVRSALDRLTPEQREVVLYKYVLGYDNDRTARLVGKNVNAVNQLHHRALASLRRLLAGAARSGT